MSETSDIDEQLRKHEGDDNSQTVDVKGASITQIGISEKTFVALVVVPALLALIVAIWALHEADTASGQAALAANNATLAERNAKLAQYQLEEAAKKYNLDIPREIAK